MTDERRPAAASAAIATESASATHAWVEVLIPGIGWRALDPTHNCQPGETYVQAWWQAALREDLRVFLDTDSRIRVEGSAGAGPRGR